MKETVTYNGTAYEVRRSSKRKYVAVVSDLSGKIHIALPAHYNLTQETSAAIAPLLEEIIKRTAALPQAKKYTEGEFFFYQGKEYPLHITDAVGLQFKQASFYLGCNDTNNAFELFEKWYKRALFSRLTEVLPKFCKQLNVNPLKISIKNTQRQWGSCSAKGNLTFCTRLALVPNEIFEYVVVHELCHLKQLNHSEKFWNEVGKILPNYNKLQTLLNKNGYMYKWW